MKIKGLLIIVICMIGLSGCTSKGFDIERVYQFVEIQSSNGKEIGTIVNSDDLEFFFEEMKFQEWKYIEEKEDAQTVGQIEKRITGGFVAAGGPFLCLCYLLYCC